MRARDLVGEAFRALAAHRSRTVLTGTGVMVGTLALCLIVSLSLGLSHLLDRIVSTDDQLRQVIVLPGFGARLERGKLPEVTGEMSEEKRGRLARTLVKRGRGGPPIGGATMAIEAETEAELAALPSVESTLPFLQDRFEVSYAAEGGDVREPGRAVLSLGVQANHPHYPGRLLAGRWFEGPAERGVVVHELLLYDLGYTSDAAQAALIGKPLHLLSRRTRAGSTFAQVLLGMRGGTARSSEPVAYEEDFPIVGVVRERMGMEPASVVEEAWAMQADLLFPAALARELWDRHEGRDPPRGLLLVARTLEDVPAVELAARERGLQVRSVREVVDRMRSTLDVVTLVALFLAGIAVFVSALGIVNTMVMSVLERTREIGLLKALGASDGDVAALFLAETALLGVAAGVAGTAASYGLSAVGNHVGRLRIEQALQMPFPGEVFEFPAWLAAGGMAFAVVTSLVAAVLPALRAARVDPVEALRHE